MRLAPLLPANPLFLALGDESSADDAAGIRLGERLLATGARVLHAGVHPERHLHRVRPGDAVVILDAADFDADPGTVTWLSGEDAISRFPQVSTHRLSLGLLCRYLEHYTGQRAWILAIQPGSLRPGGPMTPEVEGTVENLARELSPQAQLPC